MKHKAVYLLFYKFTLYVSGVNHTYQEYGTQNCNYSLRYWSYFLCSYLPPTWPSWPCWREVAAQKIWSVPEAVGTAVAQWLRRCATNWKVAGSIPEDVIGIFHWHNPSDRTMALGSTQPLTEMSTRSISWGVRKADNLTAILAHCHVIWEP